MVGGFQVVAWCIENDISPLIPLVCSILFVVLLFWVYWLLSTGRSFSYCYRELKELLKWIKRS